MPKDISYNEEYLNEPSIRSPSNEEMDEIPHSPIPKIQDNDYENDKENFEFELNK